MANLRSSCSQDFDSVIIVRLNIDCAIDLNSGSASKTPYHVFKNTGIPGCRCVLNPFLTNSPLLCLI